MQAPFPGPPVNITRMGAFEHQEFMELPDDHPI